MDTGDRVLVVVLDDPWVTLPPGTCGTVTFIDDEGTVFVDWDNGVTLGANRKLGDRIIPVDPGLLCQHESRGYSRCLLSQGHTGDPDPGKRLHSDLTLLWNADGQLCNWDGSVI